MDDAHSQNATWRPPAGPSARSLRGKIENSLCSHAFTVSTLLIYANANFLMFLWAAHGVLRQNQSPVLRWLIAAARGFGLTLNLNSGLVILLGCKSLLTKLRSVRLLYLVLPFDKAFPDFHKIVGFSISCAVVGHTAFHVAWIVQFYEWRWGLWRTSMYVTTGVLLCGILWGMTLLGIESQRSKHFRGLSKFHLCGAVLFFPLLILHGQFRTKPYSSTWKWICPPVLIYICDRAYRVLRTVRKQACWADSFTLHAADITGLTIRRPFDFKSGQYAELQIPTIDKNWHPFTIASAPHEENLRFYVRSVGKWTKSLRQIADEFSSGTRSDAVDVNCRGPYGAPAQQVNSYKRVILISGGVGATPFCSVTLEAKHLIDKACPRAPSHEAAYSQEGSLLSIPRRSISETSIQLFESCEPFHFRAGDCEVAYENVLRASMTFSQTVGAINSFPEEQLLAEEEPEVAKMVEESLMKMQEDSNISLERVDSQRVCESGSNGTNASLVIYKTVNRIRYRLFRLLHSVRFNFILTWVVIGRIMLMLYLAALGQVSLEGTAPIMSGNSYVRFSDIAAGAFVSIAISVTISFEIYYLGVRLYFRSYGRCLDFFCLVPVSILSTIIETHLLGSIFQKAVLGSEVHLVRTIAIFPLLAILLACRMYRIIGTRVLLADAGHDSKFETMESMDFVWTSKTSNTDEWLVKEMLAVCGGSFVHLHRYITRELPLDAQESGLNDSGIRTIFGARPNFEEMFEDVALRATSNSKVGVFFCGPPEMGRSVKCALMKAQARSNFRGAYIYKVNQKKSSLSKIQARGSFVRFVFREENF